MHQGEECRGQLGLTTYTLVLLCNGPEECDCFCWGCRVAEDFKAAGMSYSDKMWHGESEYEKNHQVNFSEPMPVCHSPQGHTRRVTWLNVRHVGTHAHARSSFPVHIPCLSVCFLLAFSYKLFHAISFMIQKHRIFQIKIAKVFIAAYKHFTVMSHIWIS